MKQVFTIAKQIADIVGRIIVGIFVVIVGGTVLLDQFCGPTDALIGERELREEIRRERW